jgi:hypothetical protein
LPRATAGVLAKPSAAASAAELDWVWVEVTAMQSAVVLGWASRLAAALE